MGNLFNRYVKIFGSTALLGTLLMAGGCGGGNNTVLLTIKKTPIAAADVVKGAGAGTLLTNKEVSATPAGSNVKAIDIPNATTITPAAGGEAFDPANPPTISVTNYLFPSALPTTANFVVATMSGAINVSVLNPDGTNAGKVTFAPPVTINIPITGTPANCAVYVNKNDGKGLVLKGNGVCANGVATIQVSDLCDYVVNPTQTTGGTGGTGGAGQ